MYHSVQNTLLITLHYKISDIIRWRWTNATV